MHMTESVRELMTITKLVTILDVYDDEPEALASFVEETLRIVEHQPFFYVVEFPELVLRSRG